MQNNSQATGQPYRTVLFRPQSKISESFQITNMGPVYHIKFHQ